MGKYLSLSVDNTYLRLLRTFVLSIFLKGCVVNDMKANENSPHTKTSQTDTKTPHKGKPNHLIQEKSPYLQQHAYNPVDWYPWCEDRKSTRLNSSHSQITYAVFCLKNHRRPRHRPDALGVHHRHPLGGCAALTRRGVPAQEVEMVTSFSIGRGYVSFFF